MVQRKTRCDMGRRKKQLIVRDREFFRKMWKFLKDLCPYESCMEEPVQTPWTDS